MISASCRCRPSVYTGIAKYPLLAIPVFVLAGLIFERAGVAPRLVHLRERLVGHGAAVWRGRDPGRDGDRRNLRLGPGGCGGGRRGDDPGDVARRLSASRSPPRVIAAAGATDILIPPSIAFIVYSVLVPQASVPALFAAGVIPGILAGVPLIVPAVWLRRRYGFGLGDKPSALPSGRR